MQIKKILKKYFGYDSFRPGQQEIINSILNSGNVLAILPTGAGKSLCYQLPALASEGFSLVISPLIALMKDQVDSLNQNEEIAAFINSTVDYYQTQDIFNKINSGKIKLLYVAPEKLEAKAFAERLKNLNPNYIFIDEAHCISEWGHNFRPSYRKIREFCDFIGNKKISAFTATATPDVRDDIIAQLGIDNAELHISGFRRDNLALNIIKAKQKKPEVLRLVKKHGIPAIVYTATRKSAEQLDDYLKLQKINSEFYHAGLAPEKRRMIQDDFLNDRIDVIVATNAFGMGIDKKDIRLIVHYNLTGTIESYYQEIGRAGRDGKESAAYLLYDSKDKYLQEFFINSSYPGKEQIKLVYNLICNYGSVALGSVSDKPIAIDKQFNTIASKNQISRAIFESAVNILAEAGYLAYNSDYSSNYFVKYNLEMERFREYVKQVSNHSIQECLVALLREYGGVPFKSKTKINLTKLAAQLSTSAPALTETLDVINSIGVIDFEKPLQSPSIFVSSSRVKEEHLNFDFKKISEKLEHSHHKLNDMLGLINTSRCRFSFILNYFGEIADGKTCGKCDNCTGEKTEDSFNTDYISENILLALGENTRPVKAKQLLDILVGKSSEIGTAVSNFGVLSNYSLIEINDVLDWLISQKLIGKINGQLVLTKAGKEKIALAATQNISSPPGNYEERLGLYNKLRECRKNIAARFNQTPNLVCSDELLREISEKKPLNQQQLMDIGGFNQRKFNKLGEEFLEIINKSNTNTDSNLETGEEKSPLHNDILQLINKGYKFEDICEIKKLPEAVVSVQIESIINFEPEINIEKLFKPKELKLIIDEINNGLTRLKDIKEVLPNNISYGKIRIALAKFSTKK